MNKLSVIAIVLATSLNCFSQEIEIPQMEWGKKIIANDSSIIVSGINYKKDGYGTWASLLCYDFNLSKKWEIKINKKHTNSIDGLAFWNDKLIITGIEGESANKYLNANRFVKILSTSGDSISEVNIGSSTGKVANLIVKNDSLYLGYKKSSSIYYGEMMYASKNAIAKISLTSMDYAISEHYLARSTPEILLHNGNSIFICGTQYKNEKYNVTETFLHNISDVNPIKNIIPADKMEGLANGIVTKNGITLFSYSNPFVENQDKYMRFDFLDKSGELIKTKVVLFKEMGWENISLYFPDIKNEFWLYVIKKDQRSYYVRLDSDGKEISAIQSHTESSTSTDMAINSKSIIHLIRDEGKVKLKIIER